MGQRLGIAGALLGDPGVLLFDEPVNGLDPEGIRWVRHLLRDLAAEGRTVLVSSHLINEMALTADRLVVIGRGTLIAETSVDEFTARSPAGAGPRRHADAAALRRRAVARPGPRPTVDARRRDRRHAACAPPTIGELAAGASLTLHELTPLRASLEDAFMEFTGDAVEYRSPSADGPAVPAATIAPSTERSCHDHRHRHRPSPPPGTTGGLRQAVRRRADQARVAAFDHSGRSSSPCAGRAR